MHANGDRSIMKKILFIYSLIILGAYYSDAGVDFAGDGDYITIDTELVPDGHTGGWTISAWAKVPDGTTRRFIAESYPIWALSLAFQTDGTVQTYVYTAGDTYARSPLAYDDNCWHHICGTFNGSDRRVRTYVDGDLKATSGALASAALSATSGFNIGTYRSANDRWMKGIITELAVWDTALTDAQVKRIYDSRLKRIPLQIAPSNLIDYWPLDDKPNGTMGIADEVFKDLGLNKLNGIGIDGDGDSVNVAETCLSYPE